MEENIMLESHNNNSLNRNIQIQNYVICWFGTPGFLPLIYYLDQYKEMIFHIFFFFSKADDYSPLMSEISDISGRLYPEVFQSTWRTFQVKEISHV